MLVTETATIPSFLIERERDCEREFNESLAASNNRPSGEFLFIFKLHKQKGLKYHLPFFCIIFTFLEPFCPITFDGWVCWPETPASTTAYQRCPDFVPGFDLRRRYHFDVIHASVKIRVIIFKLTINKCFINRYGAQIL